MEQRLQVVAAVVDGAESAPKRRRAGQRASELLEQRRIASEKRWTVDKLDMFLGILAETGNATHAAAQVGMRLSGALSMRARDPLVRRMWEEARGQHREKVEAMIFERAACGVVERRETKSGIKTEAVKYDTRLSIEALRLARQAVREVVYAGEVKTESPGACGESARLRLEAELGRLALRFEQGGE